MATKIRGHIGPGNRPLRDNFWHSILQTGSLASCRILLINHFYTGSISTCNYQWVGTMKLNVQNILYISRYFLAVAERYCMSNWMTHIEPTVLIKSTRVMTFVIILLQLSYVELVGLETWLNEATTANYVQNVRNLFRNMVGAPHTMSAMFMTSLLDLF